jgi:rRNA maturation endonuclease Nob1
VYHAHPLVCQRCEGRLTIVACITDEVAISRILHHLGLTPEPRRRCPACAEEVLAEAEKCKRCGEMLG